MQFLKHIMAKKKPDQNESVINQAYPPLSDNLIIWAPRKKLIATGLFSTVSAILWNATNVWGDADQDLNRLALVSASFGSYASLRNMVWVHVQKIGPGLLTVNVSTLTYLSNFVEMDFNHYST